MKTDRLTRRIFIQGSVATTALAKVATGAGDDLTRTTHKVDEKKVIQWNGDSAVPILSPAARRTIDVALEYGDRLRDEETGLVKSDEWKNVDGLASFFIAVACLLDGSPERLAEARNIFAQPSTRDAERYLHRAVDSHGPTGRAAVGFGPGFYSLFPERPATWKRNAYVPQLPWWVHDGGRREAMG